ncbi:SulP family inorganic anion transporter [Methyloceanibacter sp.]|uniref:SulP family inorganic anion transporter n=1 Tax=Methyloceanibacter sp. TaxID=1965321 RepID=UPI002D1FA194|nr:SulP family inorganic anion transporter [Methyloceanibacter sp.]
MSTLGRDALAGTISAIVNIAYCISFSALIFQGSIAAGFPLGLAALIMGTMVTGMVVALTTTLVPADAGPDTPAVAVMSVLATTVAAGLAAKGADTETMVINVMVAITVSTFLTGALLFGIGGLKLGQWLRFVPFPVIGGFLAASGFLLMTGGVEVIIGSNLTLSPSSWAPVVDSSFLPQIAVGLAFALFIVLLKRWMDDYLTLPIAFLVFLVALNAILIGFVSDPETQAAWYLKAVGALQLWWPMEALATHDIDWGVMAMSSAEIGAVCGVTAISMLLDVSSLEVARQKSADLDKEFRTNGLANVLASVLGGVAGNLSLNNSLLLQQAGAVTRISGVSVAIVCGLVLFAGADIGSFVPKAILGGMLAYLGAMILVEALVHSPAQRSTTDLALAIAIALVILYFGYLVGVVLGVVGACLLFALSYSRIGVIRRHLTRYELSSSVDRSPEQTRLLQEEGKRVHVFWLSGFIFFGSSNGLFERIKRVIEEQKDKPVDYIVLDFSGVQGLDTSAVLSLVKLRNFCEEHDVTLVFSGLSDSMHAAFLGAGFFGTDRPHQAFPTRNDAVEWCEDMVLLYHEVGEASSHTFETWLQNELGGDIPFERVESFMTRKELDSGAVLFRQGEPSDSVVFQASGCVAITITGEYGRTIRLRRMLGHTVVGEMGFYRGVPRGANVVAEGASVVYILTRESFDKMQEKDPAAAAALHKLIIRLLSDRLEFANREISALH